MWSRGAIFASERRSSLRICLGTAGAIALALGIGADLLRGQASVSIGPAQSALSALGLAFLWSADRLEPDPAPAASLRARLRNGGDLLVAVVWCALVAGLIEVSVLAVRRGVLDRFTWAGYDYVWMTPVSWVAMLLPIGIGLGAAGFSLPRLLKPWMALFVAGSAGIWGLLVLYPRLHVLAALLLAIGISWRLADAARKRRGAFAKLAARSMPLLAAVVIVWGGIRTGSENAPTSGAATPAGTGPNVLLIILDTVRAANLGVYGHERPTTPRLEEFASEGLTFERALSPSPWTLPAHATLFTGRYPNELAGGWLVPLDGARPTLAEAFRDAGYETAGFVANLFYTARESGLARGFGQYEDYRDTWEQVYLSSNLAQRLRQIGRQPNPRRLNHEKPGPLVTASFLEWLDAAPDRPFFAFLNYFDAHQPYRFTDELAARFGGGRTLADRYDAAIAYLDEELGSLFDELRERGVLERTIVVVTSDHGEHLGDHGLTGHGNSLYMPLLHVPLIIRYPSRVRAGRVPAPVSLRDVPATILDLAGLDTDLGASRSLVWMWESEVDPEAAPAEPLFATVERGINTPPNEPVALGDMHTLVRDGLHYIRNGDGREELYRFEVDPLESTDLAGTAAVREELAAFRRELAAVLAGPPR